MRFEVKLGNKLEIGDAPVGVASEGLEPNAHLRFNPTSWHFTN